MLLWCRDEGGYVACKTVVSLETLRTGKYTENTFNDHIYIYELKQNNSPDPLGINSILYTHFCIPTDTFHITENTYYFTNTNKINLSNVSYKEIEML